MHGSRKALGAQARARRPIVLRATLLTASILLSGLQNLLSCSDAWLRLSLRQRRWLMARYQQLPPRERSCNDVDPQQIAPACHQTVQSHAFLSLPNPHILREGGREAFQKCPALTYSVTTPSEKSGVTRLTACCHARVKSNRCRERVRRIAALALGPNQRSRMLGRPVSPEGKFVVHLNNHSPWSRLRHVAIAPFC